MNSNFTMRIASVGDTYTSHILLNVETLNGISKHSLDGIQIDWMRRSRTASVIYVGTGFGRTVSQERIVAVRSLCNR